MSYTSHVICKSSEAFTDAENWLSQSLHPRTQEAVGKVQELKNHAKDLEEELYSINKKLKKIKTLTETFFLPNEFLTQLKPEFIKLMETNPNNPFCKIMTICEELFDQNITILTEMDDMPRKLEEIKKLVRPPIPPLPPLPPFPAPPMIIIRGQRPPAN